LNQNQSNGLQSSGSGWYFYNTTTLSFGANNFRQKWGDRKLEDNWRRSNKRSNALNEITNETGDTVQATTAQLMDPNFYKKDIPRTKEQKDSANIKIQNAYYDLGTIYKEQLSERQRAIQTFEDLLKRYPKGIWNLETYYQLYRLYREEGDQRRMQEYANRILREFPESDYANIIRDPKYLEKLEKLRGRLGSMYDMAFTNFNKGEYERVIQAADSALTAFDKDDLLSKFALLKVMAIGATEKLIVYRKALEDYIAKYTAAPEKERAVEMLEYVKGLMGETVPDEKVAENMVEKAPNEDGYVFDESATHYYVLIGEGLPELSQMKGRISNFNSTMFSLESLSIKNLQYSTTEDLIFVQGFQETKKAMDYFNAIKADTVVFEGVNLTMTSQFVISQPNFTRFYQTKQIPPYMQFFTKNYIEKED
ncbi:MAG: tetratricopeptide repeat protein, partial [Flavobacteriales bacterium]|nr:tetratricopeptide repeat protein [Flavobacteriales bacterium]